VQRNDQKKSVSNNEPLITGYPALARQINVPERTCRTLVLRGIIPVIKAGHRTFFFQPGKVIASLEKFEIKAVSSR